MPKRERIHCLSRKWEKRLKKAAKARERQSAKRQLKNGET